MSDTELVTLKITTAEALLGSGYVPEGRNLRGKKNNLIEAGFLSGYCGKIVAGRPTNNEDFPYTVDGQILPSELVIDSVLSVEAEDGSEHHVFEDGSVYLNDQKLGEEDVAKFIALADAVQGVRAKQSKKSKK